MRKLPLLVGILAMGVSSLQASAFAAAKTPNSADKSHNDQFDSREVAKHKASFDAEEVLTTFWLNYTGGFAGPLNMIIAQDGVYNTTATTHAQMDYVAARLDWANGFEVGLAHNTGSGHHFCAEYMFLTNDQNKKGSKTHAATYDDMVSTLVLTNNTGASGIITAASGNYKLSAFNRVYLMSVHPLVHVNDTSFYGTVGVTGGYVKHSCNYDYTISASNINKNWQQDKLLHGGPFGGVAVQKHFGHGISFGGELRASAHGSRIDHTSTCQNYSSTTTLVGYDTNTGGKLYNLYQSLESSLHAQWSYEMDNGGRFALQTGWHGGFSGSSTRLFSSTSGLYATKAQDFVWGLIKAGINICY